MEIKRDFNLRKIAGEYILMPKDTSDKGYNGLISLNEVEALVWKNLERCENEEEILSLITNTYMVKKSDAKKDLEKTHAFQNDCIKISDVPNELPRNTGTRDSFLDAALSGVNIRSPIKGPKVVDLPGNALLIKEQFLGFPKNTLMLFS